ncbi:MAG TPA: 1-acyl-sn-glycerol-3-phosphate acyltransferase [bacterium]|nr:1-acyl-sn-glycerol-3-phosphate acyltransferase [bacterium]
MRGGAEIDFERLARRPARWDDALFWAMWFVVRALLRVLFRCRIEGEVPAFGDGYVLAANHASFLDPLILGASVRRRVIYLMAETVWRSARVGWFYRWTRTIPLSARGGNRGALRAARQVLAQGRVIGIFPEGGLSRDGGLMLGSPGAVSLVLNEGKPIIPVGILGASRVLPSGKAWPRFGRIVVRFGKPIMPAEIEALGGDRRSRLRRATRLIMQRIAELTGQQAREDVLDEARAVARGAPPAR